MLLFADLEVAILDRLVQLGGGFVLAYIILTLHRESIKVFREELRAERDLNEKTAAAERARNDANLTTLFTKMDGMHKAWQEARCLFPLHQIPSPDVRFQAMPPPQPPPQQWRPTES